MANDLNSVSLVGRLTRDPELRGLPSGGSVCTMRVAFSTSKKQPDGSWSDVSNFVNVTVFGNSADNAARFLSKGRQVAVNGRLQWREYQPKDGGAKREAIEIVANDVQFIGGREDGQGGGQQQAPASDFGGDFGGPPAPQQRQAPPTPAPVDDSPLPF
jgi:single-strand DNA-binding protein